MAQRHISWYLLKGQRNAARVGLEVRSIRSLQRTEDLLRHSRQLHAACYAAIQAAQIKVKG